MRKVNENLKKGTRDEKTAGEKQRKEERRIERPRNFVRKFRRKNIMMRGEEKGNLK